MIACTFMVPTLAKPWSGTMVRTPSEPCQGKSPSATISMFSSLALCQGGDFQDRGFGGGGVANHGSRPWFCEGGDHAGTGDHASSNSV